MSAKDTAECSGSTGVMIFFISTSKTLPSKTVFESTVFSKSISSLQLILPICISFTVADLLPLCNSEFITAVVKFVVSVALDLVESNIMHSRKA